MATALIVTKQFPSFSAGAQYLKDCFLNMDSVLGDKLDLSKIQNSTNCPELLHLENIFNEGEELEKAPYVADGVDETHSMMIVVKNKSAVKNESGKIVDAGTIVIGQGDAATAYKIPTSITIIATPRANDVLKLRSPLALEFKAAAIAGALKSSATRMANALLGEHRIPLPSYSDVAAFFTVPKVGNIEATYKRMFTTIRKPVIAAIRQDPALANIYTEQMLNADLLKSCLMSQATADRIFPHLAPSSWNDLLRNCAKVAPNFTYMKVKRENGKVVKDSEGNNVIEEVRVSLDPQIFLNWLAMRHESDEAEGKPVVVTDMGGFGGNDEPTTQAAPVEQAAPAV